jgi:hypothetical protein
MHVYHSFGKTWTAPQIWPKYVPNTINLERYLGVMLYQWEEWLASEDARSEKMVRKCHFLHRWLELWEQISWKLCILGEKEALFIFSLVYNGEIRLSIRPSIPKIWPFCRREAPNSFLTCPTLQSCKYKKPSWIRGFDEGMQKHRLGAMGWGYNYQQIWRILLISMEHKTLL